MDLKGSERELGSVLMADAMREEWGRPRWSHHDIR